MNSEEEKYRRGISVALISLRKDGNTSSGYFTSARHTHLRLTDYLVCEMKRNTYCLHCISVRGLHL